MNQGITAADMAAAQKQQMLQQQQAAAHDPYSHLTPQTVFVGDLPDSITEQAMIEAFEKRVGHVVHAKVIRDSAGMSKRYGFVTFGSPELRDRCLRECSSMMILGQACSVKAQHARDQSRASQTKFSLYIGNLPQNMTADDLKQTLRRLTGVDTVNVRMKQGFAFVSYASLEHLETARENMRNRSVRGNLLKVQYTRDAEEARQQHLAHMGAMVGVDLAAQPEGEKSERTLCVSQLPQGCTDDDLVALFSHYGRVRAACVVFDRQSGRPKDYAFVEFNAPSAARVACSSVNGREWRGAKLHAQVASTMRLKDAHVSEMYNSTRVMQPVAFDPEANAFVAITWDMYTQLVGEQFEVDYLLRNMGPTSLIFQEPIVALNKREPGEVYDMCCLLSGSLLLSFLTLSVPVVRMCARRKCTHRPVESFTLVLPVCPRRPFANHDRTSTSCR
ncbi:MAG: hypothetical protein MHM6MM_000461 [Cercozoa sp. M6MM]